MKPSFALQIKLYTFMRKTRLCRWIMMWFASQSYGWMLSTLPLSGRKKIIVVIHWACFTMIKRHHISPSARCVPSSSGAESSLALALYVLGMDTTKNTYALPGCWLEPITHLTIYTSIYTISIQGRCLLTIIILN